MQRSTRSDGHDGIQDLPRGEPPRMTVGVNGAEGDALRNKSPSRRFSVGTLRRSSQQQIEAMDALEEEEN